MGLGRKAVVKFLVVAGWLSIGNASCGRIGYDPREIPIKLVSAGDGGGGLDVSNLVGGDAVAGQMADRGPAPISDLRPALVTDTPVAPGVDAPVALVADAAVVPVVDARVALAADAPVGSVADALTRDAAVVPVVDARESPDKVPDTVNVTPVPDASPDVAPVLLFYIGPAGSDTNTGTTASPFGTWSYAIRRLAPGSTLVVKDGTYTAASNGVLHLHCGPTGTTCEGAPCPKGTQALPIRMVAENERRAFVSYPVGANGGGFEMNGCSDWKIEGLRFDGADDASSFHHIVTVVNSQRITLRRLLVNRNNRAINSQLIVVGHSSDVLLEENDLLASNLGNISAWYSKDVTVRRNHIYGANAPDLAGGTGSSECIGIPVADTAIDFWGSTAGFIENNVIESVCNGIHLRTSVGDTPLGPAGDGQVVYGNIVRDARGQAYRAGSNCAGQTPCVDDLRVVTAPRFEHNVAVDSAVGFALAGGVDMRVTNCSSVNHSGTGFSLFLNGGEVGLASSGFFENSLAVGPMGTGFVVSAQASWGVDHCNAFGQTPAFSPLDANVTLSTQVDPVLGGCAVAIPSNSPMKGAGLQGRDIGASVKFVSVRGVLTSTPLWDAGTKRFPCGAEIAGVNDAAALPTGACAAVHTRLGIGVGGCGLP